MYQVGFSCRLEGNHYTFWATFFVCTFLSTLFWKAGDSWNLFETVTSDKEVPLLPTTEALPASPENPAVLRRGPVRPSQHTGTLPYE